MSALARQLARHLALLAMVLPWLGLLAPSRVLAAPLITISQATLSMAPCAELKEGRPVTLPDDWRAMGIEPPAVGCYRARLHMPRSPVVPWALRIDRLPGNYRVTINGIPLSSNHMEGSEITSIAPQPYLIELPVNVLLAGDNDIEVDVRMNPFRKPGVSPFKIGPLADMRDDFDRWTILTVALPQALNLTVAGMALFLLLIRRARPRDEYYGHFGMLMLVMCGRNALYYVETIKLPSEFLNWLFFAAQAVSTYYIARFGMSYAGISQGAWKWPLRAMGFGVPLAGLLLLGSPYMTALRLTTYPVLMLCGMSIIVIVIRAALGKHWIEATAMTFGPVATFIAVAHDYLFLTPYLDVTALYWTPYCAPVIFLGFALTLMSRFVDAMNMAERLNVTLEERVADRTRALEVANQSKTRFLAAASHDLRQPTAAIGMLVSLLRRQTDQPQTREIINLLDEAVASMESLLVGLLDISRLDAGAVKPQFRPVNLQEVFQEVRVHAQGAADAKGLQLRFRLPRDPYGGVAQTSVLTDPTLLHGILRNLVGNAIRYTHGGGVLVAARRRGRHRLRIEVWDTGIGIAPDQLPHIFEEFYQVHNAARDRHRGIGLGLAIVQRTATVLGEAVSVKSRPGKGSCFAFELPLDLMAQRKAPAKASPALSLIGRHIWLVEDDDLLRRAISELLASCGARVRAWSHAEALLDELPELAQDETAAHFPDTLITDYRLPGIDGLQLVQIMRMQMKAHGGHLNALIISGDTAPAEIARLNDSGHDVMAKPFRSERLLEWLTARRPVPLN